MQNRGHLVLSRKRLGTSRQLVGIVAEHSPEPYTLFDYRTTLAIEGRSLRDGAAPHLMPQIGQRTLDLRVACKSPPWSHHGFDLGAT